MHNSDTAEHQTSSGSTSLTSGTTQAMSTMNILLGIKLAGKLDIGTNMVDNWKTYKQS